MTGTVAFMTTDWISPAPPRGMSTSRYPLSFIIWLALSREVSSTRLIAFSGRPSAASAARMSCVRHMEEWNASLPPRRMQAEPALKQSAAASTVTLGRAS